MGREKRTLEDYEYLLNEKIIGVSREKFDTSSARDYLDIICTCGEKFRSQRKDLTARFRRKKNIKCRSCRNKDTKKHI